MSQSCLLYPPPAPLSPSSQLFKRVIDQYDRLRKRNAFLEQYKRQAMFMDGLEEFDSSREVVQELIGEYEACESPDYVNWVSVVAVRACHARMSYVPCGKYVSHMNTYLGRVMLPDDRASSRMSWPRPRCPRRWRCSGRVRVLCERGVPCRGCRRDVCSRSEPSNPSTEI